MSDHDTADAGLIEVNGLTLSERRDAGDGARLESALRWIIEPQEEAGHYGFSSII